MLSSTVRAGIDDILVCRMAHTETHVLTPVIIVGADGAAQIFEIFTEQHMELERWVRRMRTGCRD